MGRGFEVRGRRRWWSWFAGEFGFNPGPLTWFNPLQLLLIINVLWRLRLWGFGGDRWFTSTPTIRHDEARSLLGIKVLRTAKLEDGSVVCWRDAESILERTGENARATEDLTANSKGWFVRRCPDVFISLFRSFSGSVYNMRVKGKLMSLGVWYQGRSPFARHQIETYLFWFCRGENVQSCRARVCSVRSIFHSLTSSRQSGERTLSARGKSSRSQSDGRQSNSRQ